MFLIPIVLEGVNYRRQLSCVHSVIDIFNFWYDISACFFKYSQKKSSGFRSGDREGQYLSRNTQYTYFMEIIIDFCVSKCLL